MKSKNHWGAVWRLGTIISWNQSKKQQFTQLGARSHVHAAYCLMYVSKMSPEYYYAFASSEFLSFINQHESTS